MATTSLAHLTVTLLPKSKMFWSGIAEYADRQRRVQCQDHVVLLDDAVLVLIDDDQAITGLDDLPDCRSQDGLGCADVIPLRLLPIWLSADGETGQYWVVSNHVEAPASDRLNANGTLSDVKLAEPPTQDIDTGVGMGQDERSLALSGGRGGKGGHEMRLARAGGQFNRTGHSGSNPERSHPEGVVHLGQLLPVDEGVELLQAAAE